MNGRDLNVNEARPREERSGGGGRPGGGGGNRSGGGGGMRWRWTQQGTALVKRASDSQYSYLGS